MAQAVSTLRQLTIGMIVGLLAFGGFVLWNASGNPPAPGPGVEVFWLVIGVLAVSEFAGYMILRMTMIGSAQRQFQAQAAGGDSSQPGLYFTLTLIGVALAEGMGLFAAVLVLTTGDTRFLLITAASLAAIIAIFPTENRCRALSQRVTGTWPTGG